MASPQVTPTPRSRDARADLHAAANPKPPRQRSPLVEAFRDPAQAGQFLERFRASKWADQEPPFSDAFTPEIPKAIAEARAKTHAFVASILDRPESEGRDLLASERREFDKGMSLIDLLDEIAFAVDPRPNADEARELAGALPGSPFGETSPAYAPNRPLAKGQSFSGAVRALNRYQDDGPDLSVGKIVKAMITGDWRGTEGSIKNAMSGAGAGGVLLPTLTSAKVIDLARNKCRILEAGAQIVPMDARTVVVPRWSGDPALAWRAENAAVAEVDGSMDSVTLTAHTLAAVVRISRELVEDTDVEAVVADAITSALAVKWDYAALYGAGTNEPTGIKVNASVTKTSLGANGATPTWDNLIDAVGRLRDNNEEPTAQIMADRTLRTLSKVKEASTNAYLAPPAYLAEVPRLTTNQVPVNLTVGTSSDTSDVFTGDFRQVYMGIRTQPLVLQLQERYADSGQIGLLVWFRGDVQVARGKALDVVTGVRP